MKNILLFLILLISNFGFCQTPSDKYDYFVQYNGNALAKKVNFDQIVHHPFLTELKKEPTDFGSPEFSALFKLDQTASIVGNFTDSIPYYRISIPIKNRENIKQFLIKNQQKKQVSDSLAKYEIQDFPNYSLFTSSNERFSMAWNDGYLVIFEFTKKFSEVDQKAILDQAAMTVDSAAVEPPTEIVEEIAVDSTASENTVESDAFFANDSNYDTEYQNRKIAFDSIQKTNQIAFLKSLFENGFVMPTSTKVNPKADISSWVNYGGVLSNLTSAFGSLSKINTYGKYFPFQQGFGSFIKGVNFDFYFDNDNARIEEIVEYSESVAAILGKVNNRKINKKIFDYFPEKEPLAFLSYHFDSEEMLKNVPQLTSEIFANAYISKEDFSMVTDLISTIVDEKATATLFDGDLSLFLQDIQNKAVKTKVTEYDDNFEATTVEKTVNKSVPLFSMIFTSTHPTFGDKLIQLGLRKKLLIQKENYYEILGDSTYGKFFILKDQDVIVISNSYENLKNNKSEFAKELKKELKRNYFTSKLNIKKAIETYSDVEKTTSKSNETFTKVTSKFKDMVVLSPKKITDNKLLVEFRLNTVETDKNVMLQTLDLLKEITKK
ncbi:hypothetical protein [Flavobacterium eburneipallidum]|uniref:hypothetical protein n=1 Tax=Flavobacterium eburneipallidum TaxID=3003263 RepID=UPI002482503F|nr:hypothetical protein [Flavobacterium eburneipallidum]